MGDFFNAVENRKAKKPHKCSYCGEAINSGDTYCFQKGNYDGEWFESKMHPECMDDLNENGEGEYLVYGQDRPGKKAEELDAS